MAEANEAGPFDCPCMEPKLGRAEKEGRCLGVDETKGRFGEVWLHTCERCGRIWLFYRVEYEAFTRSGRWFRAVISPQVAEAVTPETAAVELARSEYRVYGGSFFGTPGKIARGPGGVSVGLGSAVGPDDGPGALE